MTYVFRNVNLVLNISQLIVYSRMCICRNALFYAFALLVYQFLYSYLFYNKYCNILFDLVLNYHPKNFFEPVRKYRIQFCRLSHALARLQGSNRLFTDSR
jgi:hypothetical protein